MNKIRSIWKKLAAYYREKSGGKTIIVLKKAAPTVVVALTLFAAIAAWFAKPVDKSRYLQTALKPSSQGLTDAYAVSVSGSVATIFASGKKLKETEAKKAADEKHKKASIRYFAAQVLGGNNKGPKAIKSGSKLIGFLLNPIDTRAQNVVRVKIPQGGEQSGISIENGSTLIGHSSYNGNGEKVYLSFFRIDNPDGDSKKIAASALDSGTYTPGIAGDEYTGNGVKIASGIGFTMLAGMTDTLTNRQSLGNSFNSVQAEPTMQNALLQGASRASQDQANRVESSISGEKSYVLIPEGKEMIIELSEDFGK